MLDVTVLFLEHGHASTATGPLEVFRDAGVLWQVLQHQPAEPRFRVRSASIGGRAVRPDAPYTIQPDLSLDQVGATDLVRALRGAFADELLGRHDLVADAHRDAGPRRWHGHIELHEVVAVDRRRVHDGPSAGRDPCGDPAEDGRDEARRDLLGFGVATDDLRDDLVV